MTPADDHRTGGGLAERALQRLTREAARGPLLALTVGLQAWERTRGLREAAARNGAVALQLAAHTPLGRFLPQPTLDDDAQDEADRIATAARRSRLTPVAAPSEQPVAAPTTATTPPATKPLADSAPAPDAAREAGAPGVVTEQVERVTEELSVDEPESRDELPIPDFDNVTLGSLRGRLRSLDLEQLVVLRAWEQAHANRLPVVTLLDNRIAKVSSVQAADSTGNGTTPAQASSALPASEH